MTDIPTRLFSHFEQTYSFQSTFQDCRNLKEIPAGLFDYCKKIDQLFLTFSGCTNLTGESPYTEINGTKIHLYERDENNGFLEPTPPYLSFNGCNGLSDYEEMPDGWK